VVTREATPPVTVIVAYGTLSTWMDTVPSATPPKGMVTVAVTVRGCPKVTVAGGDSVRLTADTVGTTVWVKGGETLVPKTESPE
jgi:hypothetical protein